MQYSELQEKGFEYAARHARLPLSERLNIIARTFGVKSASIHIEPCRGKCRGQSDIMLRLEGAGTLGIGMRSSASARKDSTISECVNNALAKYNPEIAAEAKARAASALKLRETEDNHNAEQRGMKPYKFLNAELSSGGSDDRNTGWYYVTIAVDGKIIGFIESGLASDIERGVLTEKVSRPNYFVAGGLKDEDADFIFNNVGHSSIKESYTVKISREARERAEKTLAELTQTPQGIKMSKTAFDTDERPSGISDVPEHSKRNDESVLESELLFGVKNTGMFGIYQLKDGDFLLNYGFRSFNTLESANRAVERTNYKLVYIAPMVIRDTLINLNKIFMDFNTAHPAGYTGRSVSVSEVIVLQWRGEITAYYVDSIGFKPLTLFTGNENGNPRDIPIMKGNPLC